MRLFRDNASRNRVSWLIVHGLFLLYIGVLLCEESYRLYQESGSPYWQFRNLAGAGSWLIASLAGCCMAIISTVRQFRPFTWREKPDTFAKAVAFEIFFVMLSGMIMDCGSTGSLVLAVLFIANLIYLAFPARLNGNVLQHDDDDRRRR